MSLDFIRRLLLEYANFKFKRVDSINDLPFTLPKKTIGKGIQSKVYDHPTDPNTVIKVVDLMKGHNIDDYEKMVSIFVNEKNPFFPVIYEIYEIYDDYILVIVMEKLHPLKVSKLSKVHKEYFLNNLGISKQQMLTDFVELINPTGTDEEKRLWVKEMQKMHKRERLNKILDEYINRLIANPKWVEKIASRSSNDEFIKAVKILNKFAGSLDLKSDNMMFRLTKIGPQLVFSDPVY